MSSHVSTGRTGPAEAADGTPDGRHGGAAPPPDDDGRRPVPGGAGPPDDDRSEPAVEGPGGDASAPAPDSGGVSEDAFRAALARLAAGVVLVTAHDPDDGPDGAPAGMTATTLLSVSLDPPLVLVSVRTGSRMDEILERQPLWAASLLAQGQRAVAGRFAMRGRLSDRLVFRDTPHTLGAVTGAPLLDGSLATLECRTEQRVAAGDHTLVVARVLGSELAPGDQPPLLYQRGRYRALD